MGILDRIRDLLKANINDMLDKAEDPEKMLKQIIIDMEESLGEAVQGLAETMASDKQMVRQQQTAEALATDWGAKAKLSLSNGDEALARQALSSKLKSDANAKQYAGMHETLAAQVQTMREQVGELQAKIEEARGKMTLLAARAKLADTQMKFATNMDGAGAQSAFAKMGRMQEKVDRKEAEAQAYAELSGKPAQGDPFKKMEEESALDAEMQRLKDDLNKKS
jgi:phage shock protein A